MMRSPNDDEQVRRREVSLSLAVQHHGLANHSNVAQPARGSTVIKTAESFEAYISLGTVPDERGK